MKKVLVTGLSGFIGGYLQKRLQDKYEIHDLGCDLLELAKVELDMAIDLWKHKRII